MIPWDLLGREGITRPCSTPSQICVQYSMLELMQLRQVLQMVLCSVKSPTPDNLPSILLTNGGCKTAANGGCDTATGIG
jgi:hypothetical protein